jgi:hypothetical protein
MLALAGVSGRNPFDDASEEELAEEMRQARRTLAEVTGADFGYDLQAWHQYLLSSAAHHSEYSSEYAWEPASKAIQDEFSAPRRLKLVERLTSTNSA